MFDEFDDPEPPALGEALRRKVRLRVRRRRNRRVAAASALGATALVLGAAALRIGSHLDRVERLDGAGLDPAADGDEAGPSTILVVGTDATSAAPQVGGAADGGYADSMVLVRTDPASGTVRMLSVPRDLRVDDGTGDVTRLALLHGHKGPDRLVAEIEGQLHVAIDHVAVVDLDGFRAAVDELGGVRVRTDHPVRDVRSGLHIDDTSCRTLRSDQALALVRARTLEVRQDGRWVLDPTGDLGRIQRQQAFLVAALARLRSSVPNPITLDRLATVVTEHVAVDDGMGDGELLSLLRLVTTLDPGDVSASALPTQPLLEDGAALLVPAPGAANAVSWLEGATGFPSTTTTTTDAPPSVSPSVAELAGIGGVVTPCD